MAEVTLGHHGLVGGELARRRHARDGLEFALWKVALECVFIDNV